MPAVPQTAQEQLAALVSAAPGFTVVTGTFFLLLWRANGRIVTHGGLVDGLFNEAAHRADLETLRWCSGKCRKVFRAADWPIQIKAVKDIGYKLENPSGWSWEK